MLTLGPRQIMTEALGGPYPIIKPEPAITESLHSGESYFESTFPCSDQCSTSSSSTMFQQPQEPKDSAEPDPQEGKACAEPQTPTTAIQAECSMCEKVCPNDCWYCGVCKLVYCDACWGTQAPHKLKFKALASTPHEKTPLDIATKVNTVLESTEDDQQRVKLHREDQNTAWFGIERSGDSSPLLIQDFGRLNDFLNGWEAKKDPKTPGPRTPSLVSFVGQTGVGKSSLIKLLIDFASKDEQTSSTPVIGSRTDHLPTSEDVHLYLDPRTAFTKHPILLADCEGLDGGDREPLGAKLKSQSRKEDEEIARNYDGLFDSQRVAYECELQWSMTESNKPRSRGFAVTHVYPRLLYAFSDVIVFVLKNHR